MRSQLLLFSVLPATLLANIFAFYYIAACIRNSSTVSVLLGLGLLLLLLAVNLFLLFYLLSTGKKK